MSHEGRLFPVELLRQLTLAVERLAAQGLASGAVRGATEELRAGIPELDGQVQELLRDVVTILGRMAHEVAERPAYEPGTWPRITAEAMVQGAVEELRHSMPGLNALSQELLVRINRWLDQQAEVARSRKTVLLEPGARARIAAAGAVEGVAEQLHAAMPVLAPMVSELASRVGSGFVEGASAKVEARAEAFTAILESAGRRFVHAFVEELDTELQARRGAMDGAMSRAAAEMAEKVAAAGVRGATEELIRQLRPLRESSSGEGVFHRAGRELSSGILSSLREGLRRPFFVAAAGTGSALLLALVLVKSR